MKHMSKNGGGKNDIAQYMPTDKHLPAVLLLCVSRLGIHLQYVKWCLGSSSSCGTAAKRGRKHLIESYCIHTTQEELLILLPILANLVNGRECSLQQRDKINKVYTHTFKCHQNI